MRSLLFQGSQLELKHGLGRSAISGGLKEPASLFEHLCVLKAAGGALTSGVRVAAATCTSFFASRQQGTVEKVSPPPEDVARLYRALGSSRAGREIGRLTATLTDAAQQMTSPCDAMLLSSEARRACPNSCVSRRWIFSGAWRCTPSRPCMMLSRAGCALDKLQDERLRLSYKPSWMQKRASCIGLQMRLRTCSV